jgi:hypothetical protein
LGLDLEHVRAEILRILSSPGALQELRDLPEPKILGRSEPDVRHLPPYAQAIVEQLALLIERIQCEKEDRVAAQDFECASVLWDLERKLEKQRSKFVGQWPKGSSTD